MRPSVNWLLALIPVTLGLEHAGMPAPWVFFSAAIAIIPIARLIVRSTEQLATYTGEAVGGLLNATFGNAPELIIAVVALRAGLLDMVRASIVGLSLRICCSRSASPSWSEGSGSIARPTASRRPASTAP